MLIGQRHIKTAPPAISFNPSSGEWGRAYEPRTLLTYFILDGATRFLLGEPYRGWYNWSSRCRNSLRLRTYLCQENRRPRVLNYSFVARIKYIGIASRVWLCVYTSCLGSLASFSHTIFPLLWSYQDTRYRICVLLPMEVAHIPSNGGWMWSPTFPPGEGERG